ncbi:hypothetical protein [Streptomyces sp. SAI-25]|uniref:hypothetical protein n=1 Tax=Streptomyces sp. SAI-25 TaxID=1472664 RepID=UPI004039968E
MNTLHGADEHDLREALHVLAKWLRNPSETPPPAKRSRFDRPEGTGQLPVPRCLTTALAPRACGLCNDPIKTGDEMGRFRRLKPPLDRAFIPMSWLCRHCLFDRREQPRRRDLIIRAFHHLLAGSAVGLNPKECAVLHTWLDNPAIRQTPAWQRDPLDATMVRLATSIAEDKPTTWIAYPTALTALHSMAAAETGRSETRLLQDVLQHVTEWDTNPSGVDTRRYGTGTPYRQQILRTTARPTWLSELGGPFFLHKFLDPAEDEAGEETEDA